jgi:hypothetical protein
MLAPSYLPGNQSRSTFGHGLLLAVGWGVVETQSTAAPRSGKRFLDVIGLSFLYGCCEDPGWSLSCNPIRKAGEQSSLSTAATPALSAGQPTSAMPPASLLIQRKTL